MTFGVPWSPVLPSVITCTARHGQIDYAGFDSQSFCCTSWSRDGQVKYASVAPWPVLALGHCLLLHSKACNYKQGICLLRWGKTCSLSTGTEWEHAHQGYCSLRLVITCTRLSVGLGALICYAFVTSNASIYIDALLHAWIPWIIGSIHTAQP